MIKVMPSVCRVLPRSVEQIVAHHDVRDGSGHVYVEPAFAFAAVVWVIGAIEVVDLGLRSGRIRSRTGRGAIAELGLCAISGHWHARLAKIECEHNLTTSWSDSDTDTAGRSESICWVG